MCQIFCTQTHLCRFDCWIQLNVSNNFVRVFFVENFKPNMFLLNLFVSILLPNICQILFKIIWSNSRKCFHRKLSVKYCFDKYCVFENGTFVKNVFVNYFCQIFYFQLWSTNIVLLNNWMWTKCLTKCFSLFDCPLMCYRILIVEQYFVELF